MFKFLKNIMLDSCKEALSETEKKLERIDSELEKIKTEQDAAKKDSMEMPDVFSKIIDKIEKKPDPPIDKEERESRVLLCKSQTLHYMALARIAEQEARLTSLKCRELQNKIEK